MSSFNFPDNMNEPTHSTQFSFDESLICPNFISSPSLSNHASNKSAKSNSSNDDVVESISIMEHGCFMIVLKSNTNNKKGEMNSMNSKIEWTLNHLHINHEYININNNERINILDIDKINKLDSDKINNVSQTLLHMNDLQQIGSIGLQSVMLQLNMKNGSNYCLIFDDYQTCFIWHRGLKTIKHMLTIKQPITTIAFCVSTIDRINNSEMHQKMVINHDNIHNKNTKKWVQDIKNKLYDIQKHINECHSFAQSFCILDSSQHLSLLLITKSLKNMYFDMNKLLSVPFYQLDKNQIVSLREVYLSLAADLTIAILKKYQLKNDINTSNILIKK